jgi:selenoprotein W-related protein
LAAVIKREIGVDCELIRGAGGIFEVAVDGRRIFSKDEQGRFPEPDEILSELRARAAPSSDE